MLWTGLYGNDNVCGGAQAYASGSLLSVTGAAQLYNQIPEYYTCQSGSIALQAAAPPLPPMPPIGQSRCATVGPGLTAAAAAFNLAGTYLPTSACPSACGTNCRYGCLTCADGTYIGLYGVNGVCQTATASITQNSLVWISGTAQVYSSVPEFYTCSPGMVVVVSAASANSVSPPPPLPPSAPGQCTSISGVTATSSPGTPAAFTGIYRAVCPSTCGSTCRYGCLYCADGSYIGLYGNDNICAQAMQYGSGSLLRIAGNAVLYNSQPEFYTCTNGSIAIQAYAPPSPPLPPVPRSQCASVTGLTPLAQPFSVTGLYVPTAGCPVSCGTTCRYGCLYCADGTYIGLYGSNGVCASVDAVAQSTNASLVYVSGTAQTYNGLFEFFTCNPGNVALVALGPSKGGATVTATGCLGWSTTAGCRGALAGIVVGCSLAVCVALGLMYRCCLRKRVYEEGQKTAVMLTAVTSEQPKGGEFTVKQ